MRVSRRILDLEVAEQGPQRGAPWLGFELGLGLGLGLGVGLGFELGFELGLGLGVGLTRCCADASRHQP